MKCHEIKCNDGTKLSIIENDDNTFNIISLYCDISILPIASNHIKIKKDDIRVPKHLIKEEMNI